MSSGVPTLSASPPPPPPVSPDGKFWWDGGKWVPFPAVGATIGSSEALPVGTGIARANDSGTREDDDLSAIDPHLRAAELRALVADQEMEFRLLGHQIRELVDEDVGLRARARDLLRESGFRLTTRLQDWDHASVANVLEDIQKAQADKARLEAELSRPPGQEEGWLKGALKAVASRAQAQGVQRSLDRLTAQLDRYYVDLGQTAPLNTGVETVDSMRADVTAMYERLNLIGSRLAELGENQAQLRKVQQRTRTELSAIENRQRVERNSLRAQEQAQRVRRSFKVRASLWRPRSQLDFSGSGLGLGFGSIGLMMMGGHAVSTDRLQKLDEGLITLSDQAILFAGRVHHLRYELASITSVVGYKNGVAVFTKANPEADLFIVSKPKEVLRDFGRAGIVNP